jgi:2,4-dienoyl-CoA reductase-like NADH-dependent reductase (Old Yellow Enzyme family)
LSRFFKYKSADDLTKDARERGLAIRLSDDWSPLVRSFALGLRTIGNRLAIHPMEGCDAHADGTPDILTIRRFERFGAGGAKLIWGEAAAVTPQGRANPRQLVIDEAHARGLEQLLNVCRSAHRREWTNDSDLLVGLQLTHSGRYSVPHPVLVQHDRLLDPLTFWDRNAGVKVSEDTPLISDDELRRLMDRYVAAADLAYRIGFDFVDIKQCHRYLLSELLAARDRPGEFGGSFENRTRFIRELVARIKAEHPDRVLATRMNVFDGVPYVKGPNGDGQPIAHRVPVSTVWGTRLDAPSQPDLEEPLRLIAELEHLGVEIVSVSAGNPYANPHFLRPFEYAPVDGYQTPEHPLEGVGRHFQLTATIQKAFPNLCVIGSGYSWLQAFLPHAGAANVADGNVSLVGVGRASLSHPDLAAYVMQSRQLDPKRTCRTFSYCTALMRSKHNAMGQFAAGCPPFDKGVYGPIWEEAKRTSPTPLQ